MERLTHEADFGLEEWEQTLYSVNSDQGGAYNILDIASHEGEDEFDEILKTISLGLKHYEDTGLTPEQIVEQTNAGWIPVEERLPEDGTYLCTLDGELCGIEEPFTGMCGIENGIWDEPDCVIAWRPLPEPYKPESN